jgi:hypothetical protein
VRLELELTASRWLPHNNLGVKYSVTLLANQLKQLRAIAEVQVQFEWLWRVLRTSQILQVITVFDRLSTKALLDLGVARIERPI